MPAAAGKIVFWAIVPTRTSLFIPNMSLNYHFFRLLFIIYEHIYFLNICLLSTENYHIFSDNTHSEINDQTLLFLIQVHGIWPRQRLWDETQIMQYKKLCKYFRTVRG